MPIQIGQRPDHGFDEPLRLLSDCHGRIESEHIVVEDRELFPTAARLLSSSQLTAVGREMAARRAPAATP